MRQGIIRIRSFPGRAGCRQLPAAGVGVHCGSAGRLKLIRRRIIGNLARVVNASPLPTSPPTILTHNADYLGAVGRVRFIRNATSATVVTETPSAITPTARYNVDKAPRGGLSLDEDDDDDDEDDNDNTRPTSRENFVRTAAILQAPPSCTTFTALVHSCELQLIHVLWTPISLNA